MFKDGRTRDPVGEGREGRYKHHQEFSRTAPRGQTRWKRPIPFPTGSERYSPRDHSPHQSHSATPAFGLRSAAARSKRSTREPGLYPEKVLSPLEEQLDEEEAFESEALSSEYAREALKDSRARRLRVAHKENGSLRRALRDEELHHRNRNRDTFAKTHAQKPKPKSKQKALNETKVAVFIPSTVSVGNLARILGVSLGSPHFVRKYSRFSLPRLNDQVGFNGRCGKPEWRRRLRMITVFHFVQSLRSWALHLFLVLTSEYAVLLADEFNRNTVVNDEAAFDLYPP